MRLTRRMYGRLVMFGAFGSAFLLGATARATSPTGLCSGCVIDTPPVVTNPSSCYTLTTTYVPARYVGFNGGDVAVNTLPTTGATFGQEIVGAVVQALVGGTGEPYVHTKALYDASGQDFAETFITGMPPTSSTTGESNICSSILSPFSLNRMWPGAGDYYEDAAPGVIVKGFAKAGCRSRRWLPSVLGLERHRAGRLVREGARGLLQRTRSIQQGGGGGGPGH